MNDRIVLATCRRWPDLTDSDRCLAEALEQRGLRVEAAPWNGPQLPYESLYARIDGIIRAGRFVLMEVEVNEPTLGLDLTPGAGDRFAEALLSRLP